MEATAETISPPDKRIARGVVKARAKNAHSIRVTVSEDIAAALDMEDGSYANILWGHVVEPDKVQICPNGRVSGDVQIYRPKRSKQLYLTLSLKNTDFAPPLAPLEIPHEFIMQSLVLDLSALRVKDSACPTLPQGEDHGSRSSN